MFTAQLKEVKRDSVNPEISVCIIQFYKDGVPFGDPKTERGFTKNQLEDYCRESIKKFESDETQKTEMANLVDSPSLGVIAIEKQPEPETFQSKLNRLETLKRYISLSLIDESDTEYLALLDECKKGLEQIRNA